MGYNRYRHCYYNISKSKAREYAKQMDDLEKCFEEDYSEWSLSMQKDSCYRDFDNFQMRISNHSAKYKHDIYEGYLIVNIKGSKLDFLDIIDNVVPVVLKRLKNFDLSKYRFINIINGRIDCFYKGFKSKKDSIQLYE